MIVSMLVPDCLERPMGGMGEQCRQVLRAFARLDPATRFHVTGSQSQARAVGDNFDYYPVEDVPLPLGRHCAFAETLVSQLPMFATAIKHARPDVVHAYDWSTFGAGIYLSKYWGVPLIVTIALSLQRLLDDGVVDARESEELVNVNTAVEIQGMLHASAIVQVSGHYAERFPAIFDHKTYVIGNGIDLQDWDQPAPVPLPGSRRLKVVYLGRFDRMKNVESILDADLPDECDLIFVGSNRGGLAAIQDRVLAAANSRDNVHYIGARYGREKVGVLSAADAVIVPSTHEPFGIVALEALASRSILLSSFRGGMAEFLTEDAAVNCGTTPQSIGQALRRLCLMSAAERNQRIDAGLGICRKHSWEAAAAKLKSLYATVCGGSNVVARSA